MAVIARRPLASARLGVTAEDRTAGIVVLLYMIGVVLSERPALDFFGLNLTPLKILLIVVFIPTAIAIYRNRNIRLQSFDYLVVAMIAWTVLALIVNNGPDRALKFGGGLTLEVLGGYLIARAYVRSPSQLASVTRWYVLLVALIAPLAVPESLFGWKMFEFLGVPARDYIIPPDGPVYTRFGMNRAAVTFDHAILYGAFCATSLGLAWYAFLNSRIRWAVLGVIPFATFFSLSSAPYLACAFTVAFVAWEKLTRSIQHRVLITFGIFVAIFIPLQVVTSRSAVSVLLEFITLNYETAYYRLMIWEHASVNIANNPLLGIGLNPWVRPDWMPPSVDCLWLVVAMMGGIPAIAALASVIVLLMVRVHSLKWVTESRERWQVRFGWTAAVLALCLQAFTVHYWGAMHSFFFFVLGLGAWMTDSKAGLTPNAKAAKAATPRVPVRRPVGRTTGARPKPRVEETVS